MLQNFLIPIPPLPVQEEIVRVLDTFTELQAELQAELQKRLQQYEYYRDNLIQKHCVGVEYKPLCELGTFYSGLTGKSKDDFSGGNAKFITYVNIFNHPSLETDVEEKVKIAEGEKQNTVQYGDMLFTGSSETPDECGMCSVLTHHTDEEMYLNSFCFGFRFNDLNDKSPDFMKHLFRSTDIRKKICKTANGVTRFNISKKEFAKIEIPLLPLDVQVKLAAILDRFFTLTTDLTAGLPAEIEKRKQQYEYYRDKLLTFKRITK
jgi:type I restriction enzyme S subunit